MVITAYQEKMILKKICSELNHIIKNNIALLNSFQNFCF